MTGVRGRRLVGSPRARADGRLTGAFVLSGLLVLAAPSVGRTPEASDAEPGAAGLPHGRRPSPSDPADRGEAIFRGETPVSARIRDHQTGLPPEVVRCGNCHALGEGVAAPQANTILLGRAMLIEPRVRRGGPPSAYGSSTFCKLLRTGIDPAFILVARTMPTYDLSDQQCLDLWRFLTQPAPSPAGSRG